MTTEVSPTLDHRDSLRRNIPRQYFFTFLTEFSLSQGIWMLYLAAKGLNLLQIGLMETVFHATSLLMEVPTGMMADLYGRKFSRSLSRVAALVSTVLILVSKDFYLLALGFVFSALSYNLESGAGEALVYDSLKELGEEDRFVTVLGRTEVILQVVGVVSLLIGGYIATLDFDLVYKITILIGILALGSSLLFREPHYGRVTHQGGAWSLLKQQLMDSLAVLRGDLRVAAVIIITEVFGVFGTTLMFYGQNYYKAQGLNEFQIAGILAAGGILAAAGASQAGRIKRASTMRTLLWVIPALIVASIWALLAPSLTYAAFILLLALESVFWVLTGDFLHHLIPSQQRATIISLQSMLFSFLMIILFPLVGWIGDLAGLQTAFLGIAILATAALAALVIMLRRTKPGTRPSPALGCGEG